MLQAKFSVEGGQGDALNLGDKGTSYIPPVNKKTAKTFSLLK